MTSKKSSKDAVPVGGKGQNGAVKSDAKKSVSAIKSDAKKSVSEVKNAKKIFAVKETKVVGAATEPAKSVVSSSGTDHSSKTSEAKSAVTAKLKSSTTTDEPKRSKLGQPVKRFQLFKTSTRTKSLAIAAAAAQKSTSSDKIAGQEAATTSRRKVEIVKKVKKSSSTKVKKSAKSTKSAKDVSKSSKKAGKKSATATPASEEYHPVNVRILNAVELTTKSDDYLTSEMSMLSNKIACARRREARLAYNVRNLKLTIRENEEVIKLRQKMPYLVSSVVEILKLPREESDGAGNVHEDSRKNTGVVIKTSRRNTMFLPVVGLVDIKDLKPNDMIACQRETHIVMEKLPDEYDNRVKAMEVLYRPDQKLEDIGGLSKPIREMTEAIILPMTRPELFRKLNIKPPKGVLMYGEPGTGKTMLARMVAAQTKCTFIRLGGAEVVQMYAGEGAKMIRDVFKLARDKTPAIIFIDEIDALATKRYNTDRAGDREAQRTMLELLSQLDGFQPDDNIKVVAATNRVETLDPALIRSGRLDRKVELPMPDETARENIIKIHSKKMTTDKNINFKEIAAAATEFSGAECKAVCVEAGMIALRRNASKINHEDMMDAILEVKAKMKGPKTYFV